MCLYTNNNINQSWAYHLQKQLHHSLDRSLDRSLGRSPHQFPLLAEEEQDATWQ